jgi:hypothetical protein
MPGDGGTPGEGGMPGGQTGSASGGRRPVDTPMTGGLAGAKHGGGGHAGRTVSNEPSAGEGGSPQPVGGTGGANPGGAGTDAGEPGGAGAAGGVMERGDDGETTWRGVDVAVDSRGQNRLDVFTMQPDGSMKFYRWGGTDWAGALTRTLTTDVELRALAAANNQGRFEMIAAGNDNHLYYSHGFTHTKDAEELGYWGVIPNSSALATPGSLAFVVWPGVNLLAFSLTEARNIEQVYGATTLTDPALVSGDDDANSYLRPEHPASSLAVVSTAPGRLDFILGGGVENEFEHRWYDDSTDGWGYPPDWHHERIQVRPPSGAFSGASINPVAATTSDHSFRVFLSQSQTLFTADFDTSTGWAGTTEQGVTLGALQTRTQAPSKLLSALTWDDGAGYRTDVFGLDGNVVWQFASGN